MTSEQPGSSPPHHVVIVGAGFGGLQATHRLKGAPVRITLVDRRNHHLFQPLLYQVATASLATVGDRLADPLSAARPAGSRRRCSPTSSASTRRRKRVLLDDGDALPYDTLILATGARHAYFGHDEWEPFAPGLKTLEDATTLRRRILVAFERAERETDPAAPRRAPHLRHRRRRPDRRRTRRHHRRTGARHAAARLPQHRHPHGTRRADRGRPPRAGGLSRRSVGLCAALAGKPRRRGRAGAARHRMLDRRRRLWRQASCRRRP